MKSITLKSELTPAEFRQLTGWTVYKMARVSGVPLYSMYNYLKDKSDPKYREPKLFINRLFAIIYQLHQADLVTD
jgi:hypothetical protein